MLPKKTLWMLAHLMHVLAQHHPTPPAQVHTGPACAHSWADEPAVPHHLHDILWPVCEDVDEFDNTEAAERAPTLPAAGDNPPASPRIAGLRADQARGHARPRAAPPTPPPPPPMPRHRWEAVAQALGFALHGRTTVAEVLAQRCPSCFGPRAHGTPLFEYAIHPSQHVVLSGAQGMRHTRCSRRQLHAAPQHQLR